MRKNKTDMLGEKQKEVIKYLQKVESATLQEIFNNGVSGHYYYNTRHLSPVMTRLVRAGKVVRISHGRYKLASPKKESRTLF